MSKVLFNKENNNTKQSKSKQVTFVVTYHPLLKSFQSLINKHLNILYLDENAKEVFMPGPMVTFRSSRKLSSYLVRAKLYPLERVTGSCKCHGARCEVYLNINRRSSFTSSKTYQRSETCMQEHLFRHFSSQGHNGFLNDVSMTFIDKTVPSDPLKREDYWKRTLKTMAPFGLNIEDSA